jgi:cyclophilin family peptidyl-prolyl cis-trans isomerase
MNRFTILAAVGLSGAFSLTTTAQNVPPVVTSQIANFNEYAAAPARSIDLTTAFSDPDVSNAVRITTVLGNIDVALYGQQKPITVANFMKYIDQGRYFVTNANPQQSAQSFVHRSDPGFVIQGGGFMQSLDSSNTYAVLTFPPIQNEPGISNKRGTIAMAKLSGDPNSATSQWFINLADNGGAPRNLDTQNGGYTVFGRVRNDTMTVADAIAALPIIDGSGNNTPPFNELPVRNYTSPNPVRFANLVTVPSFQYIPTLSFTALSSDTAVAEATISGPRLLVAGKSNGTATITVTATDFDGGAVSQQFMVTVGAAPGRPVQVSTRMQVGTGDSALIGGFIMNGSAPKRLAIRGIGPSSGLSGALADPVLELHDSSGVIATNDNWGDAANKQEVIEAGVAPTSPNESVILTTLPSNPSGASYTAIVRGTNNTTGLGLVEVYDLDSGPGSTLLNISTRGPVGVDPNALIGGFFVGGTESKQILVRAIGPSLTAFGVPGALADPTLELHDGNGNTIVANDDWMIANPQKTQIQNSGLAPTNEKEAAVLQTLAAGPYTAVVHGANSGTGVGSVEVYLLP